MIHKQTTLGNITEVEIRSVECTAQWKDRTLPIDVTLT